MATSGGQHGNNNKLKNMPFYDALSRALKEGDGKKLRRIADNVADLAEKGERWAVELVADRLDGKAHQAVILSQDADNPLFDTLATSAHLRSQIKGVGHRTPESHPEYISEPSTGITPKDQQQEQVEPE